MEQWTYFKNLATLFEEHGYHLYMVGGSTRDFLLHKESDDLDLTTNATPEEMLTFLKDAQTTFMRFGTLRLSTSFGHVDITTFRIEKGYEDYRHPTKVEFVRELDIDAKRRDFTMNAIYMDLNRQVADSGSITVSGGTLETVNGDIRMSTIGATGNQSLFTVTGGTVVNRGQLYGPKKLDISGGTIQTQGIDADALTLSAGSLTIREPVRKNPNYDNLLVRPALDVNTLTV
ncbi:MAG: hypothetical protein KH380_03105, partial [Coprobacillus sp.]|nr:hypothetical protein [Coprobacillus sp.]